MKHFEKYKPKEKGKSDFYSWNLYRWLRKHGKPNSRPMHSIFKNESGELFIGESRNTLAEDTVHGVRLRALCSGSGSVKLPHSGCYIDSHKWQDVTDEFYAEYERIGACAIWGDLSHKFTVDGDTRTCDYCGKVERKRVKLVEKVTWEDAV